MSHISRLKISRPVTTPTREKRTRSGAFSRSCLAVAKLGTTSIVTAFSVERLDGEFAAEGELRHVFVELGGGGKTPIPEPVRIALSTYLQSPVTTTGDHSAR